jgi:hypothetical protein
LFKVTTRWQRGQAGRWTRVAPAAQSASISLSTMGKGAFAPSRMSVSGVFSSVQASFCSWAGLVTVAVMAAVTVSAVSPGSSS